ncbi:MAG: histidine phosphatase family protein [Acidimicrobiia bacterium]
MLERLHLVRHGEVANPDGVVYADLPGFSLSAAGRAQAAASARYLQARGPEAVVSSPLDRALETAGAIADSIGVAVTTDDRLLEWRLSGRWAGVRWDDLPSRFPGEVEAYLAAPYDLAFAPESIDEVAARMAALVMSLDSADLKDAVLVSHQDPLQALRVFLVGGTRESFTTGKPGHASVTTLERVGGRWHEVGYWEPEVDTIPFPPPGPP